jgi:RND family efflux transporter MFP subunit
VDIGDHVKAGQPLAEIEAPELDRQVQQAKASLEQATSASLQAEAALKQGRSNENLARTNAQRWQNLFSKNVVSRQEYDTYQAQWAFQQANVEALEKAVASSKSNIAAAQASLDRLLELKQYQTVKAPFAGVITMRNVDTGALINENNTLLFRIAQADRLRMYINVPQSEVDSVHLGQKATLRVPDLQGRTFTGVVARTASALDASNRTMLTELQVDSSGGVLMPGMYAQAELAIEDSHASLRIKGDTLVVRSDGPQVAVVDAGGRVHYSRIQIGRDYGETLEVLSGLEEGQQIVVNPSDVVREGAKVKPVSAGGKGE